MEFQDLVQALQIYGPLGLAIAAVIITGVYLAKKSGLVATGDQARIANLVLGAILAGLSDNPQTEEAMLAVLSSVLAGLGYNLIKYLGERTSKKG